ncbi:MAG: hypothetical protein ACE5ER_11845 [Nitrospinaceae bacterium]
MRPKPKYPDGMRFFPAFVMADVFVIFAFMVIFCVLVFFVPDLLFTGDAEIPADPFNTPAHIKPEWYFLASYQFLKFFPEEVGLALEGLVVGVFVLLPFLDRSRESRIGKRPFFLALVILVVLGLAGLTYWGAVS